MKIANISYRKPTIEDKLNEERALIGVGSSYKGKGKQNDVEDDSEYEPREDDSEYGYRFNIFYRKPTAKDKPNEERALLEVG
jgi:hypothetical protein